jgi:tetratricopeptide (TPR) repeat protein
MRTRLFLRLCLVPAAVALGTFAPAVPAADTPEQTFQGAMYVELGRGDLHEASRLYDQLAASAESSAELKARARWRQAVCQEKLGNTAQAVALHQALLESIKDSDPPELKQARDAAGRSLLKIAERAAREGKEQVAQKIYETVRRLHPQIADQQARERESLRLKLQGVVNTWDKRWPVNANVRIRAQTPPPLASSPSTTAPASQTTWLTKTDATGRFEIELPPGQYEVRAFAPLSERKYRTVDLIPEKENPLVVNLTLERIKLPAAIQQVHLVGNWLDNWTKAIAMTKVAAGIWELRLTLKPGTYEYKFRLDDQPRWISDVHAADLVSDSHEGYNARLVVEQEREVNFRFDENDPVFERLPP